jgi:hypothetical protein
VEGLATWLMAHIAAAAATSDAFLVWCTHAMHHILAASASAVAAAAAAAGGGGGRARC